jgi:hypothetical protein
MRLSPDARLFEEKVREAPISGNIDNPEGGFDALLQVSHLAVIIGIFKTNPGPFCTVPSQLFSLEWQSRSCLQGTLTEREGSVQLTFLIKIACFVNKSNFVCIIKNS